MHDPSTLAFDVCIWGIRLAEIWHIDPETDGTDDSCGWAYPHLTKDEKALADSLIHDEYDNLRYWFQDMPDYTAVSRVCRMFRIHKAHTRCWWQHPRWHVHHWHVKIPLVFNLKRWLFSRCTHCGKRFAWGYGPTCTTWNGTGPLWFKSEEGLYHHDCYHKMNGKSTGGICV